jgi:hypothetical protein
LWFRATHRDHDLTLRLGGGNAIAGTFAVGDPLADPKPNHELPDPDR